MQANKAESTFWVWSILHLGVRFVSKLRRNWIDLRRVLSSDDHNRNGTGKKETKIKQVRLIELEEKR